jgi:hypothetical protein
VPPPAFKSSASLAPSMPGVPVIYAQAIPSVNEVPQIGAAVQAAVRKDALAETTSTVNTVASSRERRLSLSSRESVVHSDV